MLMVIFWLIDDIELSRVLRVFLVNLVVIIILVICFFCLCWFVMLKKLKENLIFILNVGKCYFIKIN